MAARRATIHQVAERAGVSHQTVSRYLRSNGGLKPATLARVEAAIEELSYRPNLIARSMRTRRTGRIAVLLPATDDLLLPQRLLSAASAVAHEAGYGVDLIGLEGGPVERAARARELADSGEFEGILALASLGDATDSATTAVVVLADFDDELHGLGALADGAACGEVVQLLAGLGHTDLLHVAGNSSYASARNRMQTFLDTVAVLGVRGSVVDGDWSGRSGYDAIMALPADTPLTAVVAANDRVAAGVIRAALERGWRVPDDLSVFGWDDTEMGRFATPSLSTVTIDRERQGREAMAGLIARIRATDPPPVEARSLHTVIPRESTGPAPRSRG